MRNRNIHIQVWLNEKEAETLNKNVKRSGLSQSAYLRHLMAGVVPRDAPPADYYAMMRQLYSIGNSLNQISRKAHLLNVLDVQRYDANVRLLEQTIREITAAVVLPRPMEESEKPPQAAKPPAGKITNMRRKA